MKFAAVHALVLTPSILHSNRTSAPQMAHTSFDPAEPAFVRQRQTNRIAIQELVDCIEYLVAMRRS